MDDLTREFLVESYENLDQLDRDLVTLEQSPGDRETLASIFRSIHTIKGTCGFFGYSRLEAVAHAGENLLASLRDGELAMTPEVADALLATIDAVRQILGCLEHTGAEGDADHTSLVATLTRLNEKRAAADAGGDAPAEVLDGSDAAAAEAARHAEPAPTASASRARSGSAKGTRRKSRAGATESQATAAPAAAARSKPTGPSPETSPPMNTPRIGDLLVETGRVTAEQLWEAIEEQKKGDRRPVGEILVEQGALDPGEIQEALQMQREPRSGGIVESGGTRGAGISKANIRVDVGQLDLLMNLVGELVLARNQILQFASSQNDPGFLSATQRLNLITTELQEGVMKTRMQPIDNVWSKFPRVVRDLANLCGKQVRVEMEGRDTELDKTLIEAIKDPLTHLVRNAVDHGIETPEARRAAGKPAEGRLSLRAFHEGGQVNIEIADDGGGIPPERLRQKALDRGLITPDQAARLTEREALNLIFLPGFSTAELVTNVSGRGVGMDVVKTNIEKIGGALDLQSEPGRGTTVRIKVPLTLAIIPALTVTCAGDRYAIPQISLLELVRLEGEQARRGFERIHNAPVYRLRGNLLPLVHLGQQLGVEEWEGIGTGEGGRSHATEGAIHIVVLQADGRQFGLVVEGIHDTEEIVVKPLGRHLKSIPTFAGSTIMGDGRVALILDVLGLAQRAGVIDGTRDPAFVATRNEVVEQTSDRQSLLVLGVGADTRVAIPLAEVSRLEEFPRTLLEKAESRDVVQYRGEILPLLFLSRLLSCRPSQEELQALPVVVCSAHGREIGLVVDRIFDIVEESFAVRSGDGVGVVGSAVIQQHETDLLDVPSLIRAADPAFFDAVCIAQYAIHTVGAKRP